MNGFNRAGQSRINAWGEHHTTDSVNQESPASGEESVKREEGVIEMSLICGAIGLYFVLLLIHKWR